MSHCFGMSFGSSTSRTSRTGVVQAVVPVVLPGLRLDDYDLAGDELLDLPRPLDAARVRCACGGASNSVVVPDLSSGVVFLLRCPENGGE